MDQLKLVLEYKFWILAGVAILLPPIGWWAATDHLATETASRSKKIAEYDKRISDLKDVPNEKWIQGAQQIDRELTASVVQSQERLFEHQKSAMTFPRIVQNALDKCNVKYRKDGGATQDFLDARDFFVQSYLEDWKNAISLIKPFKVNTGEGLVLLPGDQTQDVSPITRHMEVEQWRQSLVFTADQMWDVQEDVWFLRSLMQAIARVNQGSTEIGNARIKKLNEATLRGGDPADLATRRAGKPSSTSTNPIALQRGAGMLVNVGNFRGGNSGESSYKPPKAFDPDDVFGDDGSKTTMLDVRGKREKDAAALTEAKRWVDSSSKWRKRGFVLRLVMDEREIPTLLTALSESAFPVEILHVEHSVHNASSNDFTRSITAARVTTNGEPLETTPEQQALQRKIAENLRMASNMHYLADVIVAGTMTIYDEPARKSSKNPSATRAGSNQAAAGSTQPTGGGEGVKTALPAGRSAKSAGTQSKPLSAFPGTRPEPAKAGAPASPLRGNKTNPGTPKAAGASNPVGTGSPSAAK